MSAYHFGGYTAIAFPFFAIGNDFVVDVLSYLALKTEVALAVVWTDASSQIGRICVWCQRSHRPIPKATERYLGGGCVSMSEVTKRAKVSVAGARHPSKLAAERDISIGGIPKMMEIMSQ